jgi:hypothetical protein
MSGFIKLMRDSDLFESMISRGKHNEFILLSVIALRASRVDNPVSGLSIGQCYLGDFKAIGLTEQKYRTAKKNLEEWKIVTFKGTSKGTIATLVSTGVYDINASDDNGQANEQLTNEQRTANEQLTTKEEVKKLRSKEVKNVRETALPENFEITEKMQAWAIKQAFTIDINVATEKWKNAMLSKGRTYVDWTAAWRTGMLKAQEWTTPAQGSAQEKIVPIHQGSSVRAMYKKLN